MRPTWSGSPARVNSARDARQLPHAATARSNTATDPTAAPRSRDRPGRHRDRRGRAHAGHERRDAVDPEDAGELRDRQRGRLAVAEEDPGEAAEEMRPPELGRHPHQRRGHEHAGAVHDQQPPHHHREQRREQREIRDEQRVDEDRHPRLQAAVDHHHAGDPIQGAGEVHEAGRQAKAKRPAASDRPRPGSTATRSGASAIQPKAG